MLAFSLFAGAASACALLRLEALELAAALLGLAGITASAYIYRVPARPAWNSRHTLLDFHLTAWLLGPLFLAALGELLGNDLKGRLLLRVALLIAGGMLLPLWNQPLAALLLATAGELLSRYLFFVSVVPRNMAAPFFHKEAA